MNNLLIHEYLKNFQPCWNCGVKVFKGKKCPTCGAGPERPRVSVEIPNKPDWAEDRPDK